MHLRFHATIFKNSGQRRRNRENRLFGPDSAVHARNITRMNMTRQLTVAYGTDHVRHQSARMVQAHGRIPEMTNKNLML